jgi:hypothetical protein
LAIFAVEANHHETKNLYDSSDGNGMAWVALVEESAAQRRDKEHAENCNQSAINFFPLALR